MKLWMIAGGLLCAWGCSLTCDDDDEVIWEQCADQCQEELEVCLDDCPTQRCANGCGDAGEQCLDACTARYEEECPS